MTAKLHDHLSYPPRAMKADRAAAYAAETGEQDWCEQGKGKIVPANIVRNATIERCAQVADEWLDTQTLKLRAGELTAQEARTVLAVVRAIAAAIRAMKD